MATTMEPETRRDPGARAPPAAPRATESPRPGGRRRTAFVIMGVVLVALAALGVRRWIFSLSHQSTDDAQVDGHIVPILPKVGGFVTEIRVDENQRVRVGDTLIVLDDRDYKVRLAQAEADLAVALAGVSNRTRVGQAEAQVEQAQANALKAHADLDRLRPLAEQDIVSQQQLDAAEAAARAADAALAAAQAALVGADARVGAARAARDQAALNLSYTRVIAPSSGVVSKKTVELGQLVQPGQPLMSVVPLDDIWVTANLKETQTADVAPGDAADITVDAYPGRHFTGHVESISPATGAKFSLLPPDNATGNFTKVVQRIPVRVRLDGANDPVHPLRPGMSVNVTISTQERDHGDRGSPRAGGPRRGPLPQPLHHRDDGVARVGARAPGHEHRERGDPAHDGESGRHTRRDRLGVHGLHRRQRDRAADHRLAVGFLWTPPLLRGLDRVVRPFIVLLRQCAHPRRACVLAHRPGAGRRRAALHVAGDPV